MSSESLPVAAYRGLAKYATYLQCPVLLLLRLAWGWEALQSGWGHLHHVEETASFFRELNIPMPVANVYISGTTELVGGGLLILGLGTRLISLPFIFNFLIAIITASGSKIVEKFKVGPLTGWTQIVDDTAFPFFVLGLIMLALGPGKISLDYLIQRLAFPKSNTSPGGFPVS
jgi:putative oxidoreductase